MIKRILSKNITKYLNPTQTFINHNKAMKFYPFRSSIFNFSQFGKKPRNKQEAWMMQQQKNLKTMATDDQSANEQYTGVSRIGIASAVIALSALLYLLYSANKTSQQNLDFIEEDISGLIQRKQRESLVGGEWTLTNTQGKPFSSRNLRGYYYLVYFGFSHCPDICPSALYSIGSIYRIIRNLPEGAYLKLKIVFISIDPERDTPSVLKKYLQQFGKHIIGLTTLKGDELQLKDCMNKFGIKAKRFNYQQCHANNKDDYNIDHTTRVFLMDPDNVYLYHLDANLTEQQSAKAIISKIVQNEHRKDKEQQEFNRQK